MGLRDIAVAAAEEHSRHSAEKKRLDRMRARDAFVKEAVAWATRTFAVPDEIVEPELGPYGDVELVYVRWDEYWFALRRRGGHNDRTPNTVFGAHLREPCPVKKDEWHYLDVSLAGGMINSWGVTSLVQMGEFLKRVETSPGVVHPICNRCDNAMGNIARNPPNSGRFISPHVTGYGSLAKLAKEKGLKPE